MSKGSIELSPKYGVNPTIPVCFWCGKEKNEIALLGRVRKSTTEHTAYGSTITRRTGDYEAPMHMVLDYEPCECCKNGFSQGVQLIEVTNFVQDERPALSHDEHGNEVFPTGRTVVLYPEAAQRIFNLDKTMLEAGKKLCLLQEIFDQFMPTDNN